MFGRGTDNALWWTHQVTGSAWSSLQSLGGVITSPPAAAAGATAGSGPLVALARAPTARSGPGSRERTALGPGRSSLGGVLLSGTGPAAVTARWVQRGVAVTGTNHHVWLSARWGCRSLAFIDFGGVTSSTPGITATSSPGRGIRCSRAVRTTRCGTRCPTLAGRQPSRLDVTGRQADLGPAAAAVPGGKTYVFVLGTDNLPWMRNGIWPSLGGWTRA